MYYYLVWPFYEQVCIAALDVGDNELANVKEKDFMSKLYKKIIITIIINNIALYYLYYYYYIGMY